MHILTVGNSYTGKTNLNKRLAMDALARNQNVIVFDPLKGSGWPGGSVKFSSPELFLQHVSRAESSHVFVDEAKILWDHDYKRADRLLYNRRHQGLLVYLIAQRTRMVPPNARNQCSKVFAFRQQKTDADILADEYHELMAKCRAFEPGQFVYSDGFHCASGRLIYSGDGPPSIDMLGLDNREE
jgi:hypothetical protein